MKRWAISALIFILIFLASCTDNRSDKEVVVDAIESVLSLEQYDLTNSMDLNIEGDLPSDVKPYIEMVNDAILSVNVKHDEKKEKSESMLHVKGAIPPISIDVKIPMLEDWKNQKSYIGTDSLVDNFGPMFGLPVELKGKLIEMDGSQDMIYSPSYKKLRDVISKSMLSVVKEKGDQDFSSEGKGVYKVDIEKSDLTSLFLNFMREFQAEMGQSKDEGTIEDELKGIEEAVEAMFEDIQIRKLYATTTVDGDDVEEIVLGFDFSLEDEELGNIDVSGTIDFVYHSINEPVKFTIDPADYEVISFDELGMIGYY